MTNLERHAVGLLVRGIERLDRWERTFISDLYLTKLHHDLSIKQRFKLHGVAREHLPEGWEERFWRSQAQPKAPSRERHRRPGRHPLAGMQLVLPGFGSSSMVG